MAKEMNLTYGNSAPFLELQLSLFTESIKKKAVELGSSPQQQQQQQKQQQQQQWSWTIPCWNVKGALRYPKPILSTNVSMGT
jgi:hypothetical protein